MHMLPYAFILRGVYPHGRNYSSVCCCCYSFWSAPNFFFSPVQETQIWRLGSGRCPGVGNSNPFQYSCLENSMDRGAWWATVHGVANELDTTWYAHIFISGCAVFCCSSGFSLVAVNQDCSSLQYEGFSFQRLLVADHGLWGQRASVVAALRL